MYIRKDDWLREKDFQQWWDKIGDRANGMEQWPVLLKVNDMGMMAMKHR